MKRTFTKPNSEYEVSTTLPPNKELDELLARFAKAIDESNKKSPGWFIPLAEFPRYIPLDIPSPKQVLFNRAEEAWDKAVEEYEPTEEELIAEDQLRMFCDGDRSSNAPSRR